jgi:hypothetical protein
VKQRLDHCPWLDTFLISAIYIGGSFDISLGPVCTVDLHFPRLVELCSNWMWNLVKPVFALFAAFGFSFILC